jgi:hypothetical protein
MSKKRSGIVIQMEEKRRKAELHKRKRKLQKKRKQRALRKHHERSSQQIALQRGKRARRLLNADTQMRARMLEREKPWCHRKHFFNRFGLIITTSISMFAALVALFMSTIIINFRFPYEEMHACGMDRNVWLTDCDQVQLVQDLPFRCCEANIPLPPENIDLRLHYLQFDPTGNVQSCGDSVLYDSIPYESANKTRVEKCAALTNPKACATTRASQNEADFCTWYFGYKEGPCDREIQHAACESIETEVECALNKACRANKDPWYMDAIIDGNPVSTSSGEKKLKYIGKCVMEGAPKNITATTCGMSQMDYCGDGKGPGTMYFDHIAWETFEMTTAVGVMVLVSPMMLFLRGIRVLEMEPMRKAGIFSVVIFGILASGVLSSLPFYLSRDMRNTCSYYRKPESAPIADGVDRSCQSEVCSIAKQSYIDEVCRLGDNILETLIMCLVGSGMSVFSAIIAHRGGNEDRGFSFEHVGNDDSHREEEQLLAEAKHLDDHEEKIGTKRAKIKDAKYKLKSDKQTEEEKAKNEKKRKKRKAKMEKVKKARTAKQEKAKKAREKMKEKHEKSKEKHKSKKSAKKKELKQSKASPQSAAKEQTVSGGSNSSSSSSKNDGSTEGFTTSTDEPRVENTNQDKVSETSGAKPAKKEDDAGVAL